MYDLWELMPCGVMQGCTCFVMRVLCQAGFCKPHAAMLVLSQQAWDWWSCRPHCEENGNQHVTFVQDPQKQGEFQHAGRECCVVSQLLARYVIYLDEVLLYPSCRSDENINHAVFDEKFDVFPDPC